MNPHSFEFPNTHTNSTGTLLSQLSTKPPRLSNRIPVSSSRSNTQHNLWREPDHILPWRDFTISSLKSTCGGTFYQRLKQEVRVLDFTDHFDEPVIFTAEQSLECFYSAWSHKIVSFALREAQEVQEARNFPLIPNLRVYMAHGCDTSLPKTSQGDRGRRRRWRSTVEKINEDTTLQLSSTDSFGTSTSGSTEPFGTRDLKRKEGELEEDAPDSLPDWGGVLHEPNQYSGTRPLSILPGDTKLSYKWKSEKIEDQIPSRNVQWAWPIKQLFTYCKRAKSRYGYIITDEEIVVARFSEAEQSGTQMVQGMSKTPNETAMEWHSIKYEIFNETVDEEKLTVNLALWWIHLLAANSRVILPMYEDLADEKLRGQDDSSQDKGSQNTSSPLPFSRTNTGLSQEAYSRRFDPDSLSRPPSIVSSPNAANSSFPWRIPTCNPNTHRRRSSTLREEINPDDSEQMATNAPQKGWRDKRKRLN